jgi:hypothetical protein
MAPLTQLKNLRVALTTIKDPKCFEALVNLESHDVAIESKAVRGPPALEGRVRGPPAADDRHVKI